MEILVRFYGTFRSLTGVKDFKFITEKTMTVNDLISFLTAKFSEMQREDIPEGVLPSSLIILNGVEINNIEGLNSKINDCSEITFIPVNHGG